MYNSITIGIPTFNRPKLLNRALESVAQQTHCPSEVIVGDNASNEETEQIVNLWRSYIPNLRYTKRNANIGALANMMEIAKEAKSERIIWLSDDDVMHPNMLEVLLAFVKSEPKVQLVGWGFHVKNYVSNHVDISTKLPVILSNADHYTNCRNYLLAPQSPYFYGAYDRETLLKSILANWSSGGIRFDWMDVAFTTYMLLNAKCHFLEDHLVTFGIDSDVRPKKGADGHEVRRYNPTPWLIEGAKIILRARTITGIQKIKLLSLFYTSWRSVTKHA